jgi:SAM-dependent methyltransferase
MNADHRCACASDEWRATVRDLIMPWVLAEIDLGDDVLEIGPGFGATTEVLRERVAHLTAVEIDPGLASELATRLAGTNVEVVVGDATALDLDAGRFTAAASFSMLHHVPGAALQDRLFGEVRRVLRPGGVFVATDSLDREDLRSFHHDDTFVPVDPAALPGRLADAGFVHITVEENEFAWKALAATPRTGGREVG